MQLNTLLKVISVVVFSSLSNNSISQSYYDCGETPVEPNIVDGSTASKEQLVINSAEVNAYIEQADIFLDCQETLYKRNSSTRINKDRIAAVVKSITASRNEIGEEFNKQVAVYKSTNSLQ